MSVALSISISVNDGGEGEVSRDTTHPITAASSAFQHFKNAPPRNIVLGYEFFDLGKTFCWCLEAMNFKVFPTIVG